MKISNRILSVFAWLLGSITAQIALVCIISLLFGGDPVYGKTGSIIFGIVVSILNALAGWLGYAIALAFVKYRQSKHTAFTAGVIFGIFTFSIESLLPNKDQTLNVIIIALALGSISTLFRFKKREQ